MVKGMATETKFNHNSTSKTSACIIPLAKASHKVKPNINGAGEIYCTPMEVVHSHMVKGVFSGRDEELRTEMQSTTPTETAFQETSVPLC